MPGNRGGNMMIRNIKRKNQEMLGGYDDISTMT